MMATFGKATHFHTVFSTPCFSSIYNSLINEHLSWTRWSDFLSGCLLCARHQVFYIQLVLQQPRKRVIICLCYKSGNPSPERLSTWHKELTEWALTQTQAFLSSKPCLSQYVTLTLRQLWRVLRTDKKGQQDLVLLWAPQNSNHFLFILT